MSNKFSNEELKKIVDVFTNRLIDLCAGVYVKGKDFKLLDEIKSAEAIIKKSQEQLDKKK